MTETAAPTRFIVVAPAGAINPVTGGGQRTRLFFEACARSGPTDLVLFGGRADEGFLRQIYPEARAIHLLPPPAHVATASNPVMRKINGARVMLSPRRAYAPDARTGDALRALAAPGGTTVFVFRYARTYCATDLLPDAEAGHVVCVDVDDRDDQKYQTYLRQVLGRTLADLLFQRSSIETLRRTLKARLSRISAVWFAAPEDVWPLGDAVTGVVPNVASVPALPGDLPPPSEGRDVLFVGGHAHTPNRAGVQWFLRHCWTEIAAAVPDARLRIVGSGGWETRAAWTAGLPRVDLVGRVEDLGAEYARARLAICPIFEGGGSKIKVLEAATYGRPVVASSHSARGFDARFVAALTLAETPTDYAQAVIALLQDGAAADAAGAALERVGTATYAKSGVVARLSQDLTRLAVA